MVTEGMGRKRLDGRNGTEEMGLERWDGRKGAEEMGKCVLLLLLIKRRI